MNTQSLRYVRGVAPVAALILSLPASANATELAASDGAEDDYFGMSVGASGDCALVGAYGDDDNGSTSGSAYYFNGFDSAGAAVTQSVKLSASDGAASDNFGFSLSLSGDNALVGAYGDDDNGNLSGSAFYFKGLASAGASVTQNVKLTASDGAESDYFGRAVSLSGDSALVSAHRDDDNGSSSGSAYYFKDLDSAGATATQDVKLTASNGAADDYFGYSLSLSGDSALVGAYLDDDNGANSGSAYYFKDLDSAGASVTQNVQLTASDGAEGDLFGFIVSLYEDKALVGAYRDDDNGSSSGSAYYFKDLDSAGAAATQNVKLTALDGAASDNFGYSLSLSGDSALVGAYLDDDMGSDSGSVYFYSGLDSAGATVTQSVKLTATDGAAGDFFGYAVSLSGDNFVIGAYGANSNTGSAYYGTISSITTLNAGSASRSTGGISFVSQTNWIVGLTADGNTVTLSAGDSATVSASGCAVYIGQNAGSDNNTLVIGGTIMATNVYIGSLGGNSGNTLRLTATSTNAIGNIYLSNDNELSIAGNHSGSNALLTYLGSTSLYTEDNVGGWLLVDAANNATLLSISFDGSFTHVQSVPEPARYALFGGLVALGLAVYRRRRR